MRNSYLIFFAILMLLGCIENNAYPGYYVQPHPTKSSSNPTFTLDYTKQLPWSLEIGLGYGYYQNMIRSDGSTALARIGIAKEFVHAARIRAGMELGVQSGNTARVNISEDIRNSLGGLPIDSTMKPTLDLLFTSKIYPQNKSSFFMVIKAGPIYRNWQFTRGSINDLEKINPEAQLGIGFDINRFASVSLSYQGIFGNNPNFKIVSEDCLAHVSGIPGENSIIAGLSIYLDEGIKT